jgi:hypothetical protein
MAFQRRNYRMDEMDIMDSHQNSVPVFFKLHIHTYVLTPVHRQVTIKP